jgi:hypothetical protein
MKYIVFIVWMIFTPFVAILTGLFVFGLFGDIWFDLGGKILDSK